MKFGKVIRKAILACPYVSVWMISLWIRDEWQDYWMDYKSFKTLITDINKEKKEMEEALKTDDKTTEQIDIDISLYLCFAFILAALDKEKQFFRELSESVIMVDTFFCKIQVQYVIEVKQLIEEVKKVDSVRK